MDELRRRLTKIGNDPVLRAAARWTVGMAAAFFLVCFGLVGVLTSPSRSIAYRVFGGLPRLIHADYVPEVGLVAPDRGDRKPRWWWTISVGWWLGWGLAAFIAWPLLAFRSTVPLAFRVFAAVDTVAFLPKEPRPTEVILLDPRVPPPMEERERVRQHIPKSIRFQVLQRDGWRCQYCGASPSDVPPAMLHIDHRRPVALGGANDVDNLLTACRDCNLGKGARHDTSQVRS